MSNQRNPKALSVKHIAACALNKRVPLSLTNDIYNHGKPNEPSLRKQLEFIYNEWTKKPIVNARWLGAAGVEFCFDGKVFLVDPYLTRTVSATDAAIEGLTDKLGELGDAAAEWVSDEIERAFGGKADNVFERFGKKAKRFLEKIIGQPAKDAAKWIRDNPMEAVGVLVGSPASLSDLGFEAGYAGIALGLDLGEELLSDIGMVDPETYLWPVQGYVQLLKQAKTPIYAIMIGHTHWDHCADVSFLMKEHQAQFRSMPKVWGTVSMKNLLTHFHYDGASIFRLVEIETPLLEGTTSTIYLNEDKSKSVEITPYLATHNDPVKLTGDISADKKPERVREYKLGKMISFKLKFRDGCKVTTIYVGPASNHAALAKVKKDSEEIDAAFLSVTDWIKFNREPSGEQAGVNQVVEHLTPATLYPIHFDDALVKLPSPPLRAWQVPENIPYGFYFGLGVTGLGDEDAKKEFKRFTDQISQEVMLKVPKMFTSFPIMGQIVTE